MCTCFKREILEDERAHVLMTSVRTSSLVVLKLSCSCFVREGLQAQRAIFVSWVRPVGRGVSMHDVEQLLCATVHGSTEHACSWAKSRNAPFAVGSPCVVACQLKVDG